MDINSKIFVRGHFLQVDIFIYKLSISVFLGLDNHNFSFVGVNSHTHMREEILEKFVLLIKVKWKRFHKNNLMSIDLN